MPRSYDVTPAQITHHPTQRIDPVPGRLPDITPQDLVNGFAKAMKMLTGVDITSNTAFFQWLKESTGLDFIILGQIIDAIIDLLGIDPDNPVDIEAQWAKIKQEYLDPISDFLTPDSPLNGANLFGLLDIPFVMLRNSNQELLENPTFFGDLAVGNRRRWSHVTDVYRNDADPPGAETVVCNGELTAIRSNRGKVAEGQKIVGEIHVLGNQVTGAPGAERVRLQLVSYFNKVRVGTPVSVGLTSFTLDPAGAGWVGAPNTALAGRLELDWTVPAGVDEVELRTEVTAGATSGRVWADSGSLQRGFNWNRVERDLQDMLGILDGIADPDHWEAAYLGLKDLLSLVGIDTSGWVTSTGFDFWRDFNTHTAAIVRVFTHLGSEAAWEDAWDGLRGLAAQFGVDTSDWPQDLTPGGLIVAFAGLVAAGNALFKDVGTKSKWAALWAAFKVFVNKLLGAGAITWPELNPGGVLVDALDYLNTLSGGGDGNGVFPKPAGGVSAPTGLKYTAKLDLGGVLPSGNIYYCVTAVVDGVETEASAEVMYFAAGLGTVGMKMILGWDAVAGATAYPVYRRIRSLAGDVTSRRIATVTGTTFTDQLPRSAGTAATPPVGSASAGDAGAAAAAAIGSAQASSDGIASSLVGQGLPNLASPANPTAGQVQTAVQALRSYMVDGYVVQAFAANQANWSPIPPAGQQLAEMIVVACGAGQPGEDGQTYRGGRRGLHGGVSITELVAPFPTALSVTVGINGGDTVVRNQSGVEIARSAPAGSKGGRRTSLGWDGFGPVPGDGGDGGPYSTGTGLTPGTGGYAGYPSTDSGVAGAGAGGGASGGDGGKGGSQTLTNNYPRCGGGGGGGGSGQASALGPQNGGKGGAGGFPGGAGGGGGAGARDGVGNTSSGGAGGAGAGGAAWVLMKWVAA